MSDVRASTPSNAAERVVPARRDIINRIEAASNAIENSFSALLYDHQHRIAVSVGTILRVFSRQSDHYLNLVSILKLHLGRFGDRLVHYKGAVDLLSRTVVNLNPERLLSRGYAIVRSAGKVVRSSAGVKPGDDIEVRLGKGSLGAKLRPFIDATAELIN